MNQLFKLASLLLLTTKLWRHLVHAVFFILARFFPYYMYSSTCSVLEHEVILARGKERGYVYWEINVSNVVLNHVVDR